MAEQKEEKLVDRWGVRNVHPEVIKFVRLYSVDRGIGVAQALKELLELAQVVLEEPPEHGVIQSKHFNVSGDLKAAYKALGRKLDKK